MQVDFTAEQEARLSQIANHAGTNSEELVREVALRLLQEDAAFHRDVDRGIAAAAQGQFVAHAEVWDTVETLLKA